MRLEDKGNFPDFVKEVWGGRETCPTTGRLHFQGCLVTQQCRFSQIKSWLGQTRIEIARKEEALKKYVLKEETSAGPKQVTANASKYLKFHDALIMVAQHVDYTADAMLSPEEMFRKSVNTILWNQPELAGLFANPTMKRFYTESWHVWRHHADLKKESEGAGPLSPEEDSITPPQGPTGTLEIIGCLEEHPDAEECRTLLPRTDWCQGCENSEKRYPIL